MRVSSLTIVGGIAVAVSLISGCASRGEDRVAVVTPPVVTIPATASATTSTQSPGITMGMKSTGTPGMLQLQSFAGDVCLQESDGTANVAHCVCQQTNCSCQNTGTTCRP